MKIIDRYIGGTVIGATLTVLLVLLAIFSFFSFVDELQDLGHGEYGLPQMALVVVLRLPGMAYDLMPIAALIGGLIGLGGLSERNEIAIVRSAGVSKGRVVWAAMKGGLVVVMMAILIGEFVFPSADREARAVRGLTGNVHGGGRTARGFWARDGDSFINIKEVLPGDRFRGINILEFDHGNRLLRATHATSASYGDGQWRLQEIGQTDFTSGTPVARKLPSADWNSLLDPQLINMIAINPDALSALDLLRYVGFVENNGQNAERWKHALWIKLAYPLAAAVMVYLAIPLVLGASRSVSSGRRILTGALIGLAFHILNQTSRQLGVVFGVPAALSALGPTLLLLAVALILHSRAH